MSLSKNEQAFLYTALEEQVSAAQRVATILFQTQPHPELGKALTLLSQLKVCISVAQS